jgi:hypothetical protein
MVNWTQGMDVPSAYAENDLEMRARGYERDKYLVAFHLCLDGVAVIYWWSPSPDDILAQDWVML